MNRTKKAKLIAEKNDKLRKSFAIFGSYIGLVSDIGAQIMITSGIDSLHPTVRTKILEAVQAFSDFPKGDDPYGEHDFGKVVVLGIKVYFKIDYYDQKLEYGSPDPTDDKVTRRVLTIMLASEY